MEMEAAKKAVAERERRAQEIFKPTEEWGPTKLLELLGGSAPYMLAPVAAAGAAATLPVTGTAAAALGLGAAGLASAAQFTGTNLQRQLETGKQLEETDLVKAALASLPMAALDTLSLRLLPGVGRLLGDAGIKVTKETAKEVSEQILKKAALDYTKATGRAMGAEGLTETAQQVFERLQAGLSIRDPEARKEYVESFIGGALLGGTLAPAGRYMERSRAEREIGKLDEAAAAQQRAAEEERKKSPEYLQQTAQEYQNLQAQREALTAQIKRGTEEAPLSQSDKDANDVLIRQVKALDRPLAEARAAFLQAGGPDALKALKARELMPSEKGVMDAEAQQVRLEEAAAVAEGRGDTERAAALRQQLAALQQEQAPEAPEAQRARLTREIDGLARVLEQRREAMQAAQTPEEALAIAQRAQQADKALKDAQAALAKLPVVPEMTALQRREKTLTKQYQDALQAGDQERVLSLAPKLVEVRQQIEAARPDTGLFAPEMVAAEEQRRADLIEEMAAGRERAAAERQQLDTEQQVAREQAVRSAALREQLEAEGTAEREAMSELASSRAADMRVRGLEPLKGAQQLALFPESREDVTRSKEGPAISGEQMRLREQIAELEARKEREQNPQRAAQIENQLVPLREQLADLEFQTVDTARTAAPPETPTAAIGPQGTQAQRLNTLAERVLGMRNVDEDTKELVRQVQDNLPLLLQREAPISVAGARRGQMRAAQKQGETVGAWLYRTLQGTAPPELTQSVRDRLAELEAGRRSETERTPTGEIRRGVQAEIEVPATDREGRPQPQKGTLFEDFKAFTDYLASEGLQAYRLSIGQIFPTLANVQKKLAPLQERVADLRNQFDAVAAQREAVLKADAAERASAEALLRETRAALQRQVNELDAWVQSAGKTLRGEDLIAAERAARQRVEEAAAKAAELRGQFEQATQTLTDTQRLVEAETQLVTLDSAGRVVSAPAEREPRVFKGRGPSLPRGERQVSQPTGVLQVYAGQLPSYEALRKAQAELRKRADALAAADKALEQVVKQGIGQDWSDGSSTLRAYLAAKKRKDTAQKEFEFAYRAFGTASKNIPTQEAINDKYIQAYKNKALLDAQLAKAVRALSAARGRLQDTTTRLNAYYTAAQNTGDVRFGENLQRLRNDLLAAEGISAETAQRSQARRTEAAALAQQARGIAAPMRAMEQQTERALREARERAEQRRAVPAGETKGEREARDAQQRREEQARLERGEAAGEIVRFEKDNNVSLADNEYVRLVERTYSPDLSADERMQAANEADAYLAEKISKQNAQAGRKQQLVETHTTYLKATQEKLSRAREALEAVKLSVRDKKAAKTPEAQAAKLEEKRAKLKQKIEALEALEARHKQNLLRASTIGRVIRTTRKEIQAYREALNRDVARTRVPGERLGEAEGTQRRATGPVTRPGTAPPRTLRTGTEESRAGETTTPGRMRYSPRKGELVGEPVTQESRTPTPRDTAVSRREMAEAQAEADRIEAARKQAQEEANRIAAELAQKTPEQKAKEQAEEEETKKEQAKLQPKPSKVTPLKANKPTRLKGEVISEVEEDFEPEIAGTFEFGPQDTLFSRGATPNPSTTASVRAELKQVFPDTGRVQVYDSVEALVSANPQYEGRIPSDARGFVDTAGNKAFLIAENINQGQALSVLLHEVGAHIGLKNALGEAQYNALVNAVKSWEKRNDGSKEAQVAQAARARVEAAKTPAHQVNDELLAYAIEEAVNAGVRPTETKGVLGQWLSRVAALLRKALEKFGLPPKALDAQGLVDMAFGAAKMEMRPAMPQMSRRQFLRGAGAALGTMKLPPLSKEMQLDALKAAWSASRQGYRNWVDAISAVAKTPAIKEQLKDLEYGFSLADKAQTPALQEWLSLEEVDGLPDYDIQLEQLLSGKDGVAIVADLQQALRAQAASFVDAVQKMAKEKGLPEVGELFFTYAGERSGIASEQLRQAKDMAAQGAAMENIWKDTGWFQGADKKWRYEIDDSKAQFRFDDYYDALKAGNLDAEGRVELKLSNILWHPALYKAYPTLKDLPVKLYEKPNSGELGSFGKDGITLNLTYADSAGVLLHEVQHYIQGQEGFTRGSNSTAQYMRAYKKNVLNAVRESYARMADSGDAFDRSFYGDRVAAMDAGIAAAEKARSARAKELAAAIKEYREAKALLNKELEQAHKLDDFAKRFAASDAAYAKMMDAHRKFLSVRYSTKDSIGDAIEAAIQTALPKNSVFARYAKLSIADQAYQNMLGEVEARDVEARRNLTPEERAATRPYSSQPQSREEILFSRAATRDFPAGLQEAGALSRQIVGREPGAVDKIRASLLGARQMLIDKLSPVEEAVANSKMESLKAMQLMYYLRMYDQRMNTLSQAISTGAPAIVEKTRPDGRVERLLEAQEGANIKGIVNILSRKDVVKAANGADNANALFTTYLAALRAERVGVDKLDLGKNVTQKDLDTARAQVDNDPVLSKAFREARDLYNQYNRNLLDFVVQTGALSREDANALLADNDYIPYYRIRNGQVDMLVGGQYPIRVGNLKDSPHLRELVGGEAKIMDFMTSSVQNTAMLLDMGMRNLAMRNMAFEFADSGIAKIGKLKKGAQLPEKAFEFKRDGEDYFAVIDEEKAGVDAEMLVRGLAGIPTMFPTMIRVMGGFSRVLRRAVVASPVYIARQMFRETLGATMTSGANLVPVVSAIKQIGKSVTLERRGITGGQVFTGLPEDMTRLLKEMQSGRPGWMKAFSKLEAFSAQADALTRKAQYDSYIEQGRSELEATYMSLESMNFTRRGLSPSLHMLSMMIPFFNAQIQGLDVLYRAFRGKMPLNDKLDIRNKLLTRGALLAGLSLLYAANMEDDETYANARPEEKYNNWFVRMPALDEMAGEKVTLRVPIPFELGYIFKALPEALYNTMATEKGGEDAVKAFKSIATMMVPGLSSYFLPQAIKPAIETAMGTSILSGRSIESAYEQMVEPGQRVREGTSDVARIMGETLNISPVKLEYLIRGYTGSLGMALVQSLNFALPDAGPEAAYKRLSAMPVVGTLFQPEDSGGIIDAVYARMREVNQAKETYERLLESGQVEKATEFFNGRVQELTQVSMYGNLRQQLGELTAFERQVRASSMTPADKRETLDNIRRIKIEIAKAVRSAS